MVSSFKIKRVVRQRGGGGGASLSAKCLQTLEMLVIKHLGSDDAIFPRKLNAYYICLGFA